MCAQPRAGATATAAVAPGTVGTDKTATRALSTSSPAAGVTTPALNSRRRRHLPQRVHMYIHVYTCAQFTSIAPLALQRRWRRLLLRCTHRRCQLPRLGWHSVPKLTHNL